MEQAMELIDLCLYQPLGADQPDKKISKNKNFKADLTDYQAMSLMRSSKGFGNSRVVITGSVIEFDLYENPVPLPGNKPTAKTGYLLSDSDCCDTEKEQRRKTGQSFTSKGREFIQDGFSQKDRTYHTKNRRREARWLINTNFANGKAMMLTLSFSEPVMDYDIAHKKVKRFLDKLKKNVSKDIRYFGVPEKHDSGAWHFHILIDRYLPLTEDKAQKYIESGIIKSKKGGTLQLMWQHGSVHVKPLNGGGNIGASVGRYITKMSSDITFKHRHYFLRADNLQQPIILKGDEAKQYLLNAREQGYYLTWSSSYVTDTYVGTIRSYHYRRPARISSALSGKKVKLVHTAA